MATSINLFNGLLKAQTKDYQNYAQKKLIDYLLSGEANKDENSPGGTTRDSLEKRRQEMVEYGNSMEEVDGSHLNLIAATQNALKDVMLLWNEAIDFVTITAKKLIKNAHVSLDVRQRKQLRDHIAFTASMAQPLDLVQAFEKIVTTPVSSELKSKLANLTYDVAAANEQLDVVILAFESKARENTYSYASYRKLFRGIIAEINELISQLPAPGYSEDEGQDNENREGLNFYQELGEG